MEESNIELNKLKVKNFPETFSHDDKKNFLVYFGAVDVVLQRDFVIARFKNEIETTKFLRTLHQKEILGRRLRVEYFTKGIETKLAPSKETSEVERSCNDYILKWFSMNSELDFSQPPPPYLRYKYPKATREIIDSICVALESVPKFYTQVLHLMNKMNLPPPFTSADVERSKLEKCFLTVSCQTEISNVRGVKRRIWSGDELLSDESEMESDDDEKGKAKADVPEIRVKRLKKSIVTMQNPAKRFLQQKHFPKSSKKDETSIVFETSTQGIQSRKITMYVPTELSTSKIVNSEIETLPSQERRAGTRKITREDLASNRLTPDQLSILPVFKNYEPGERSNKLYIKNLSKTVSTEDLEMIYANFTKKSTDEIQIKLMQTGRMKGQAFVTFNTPYDEEDLEAEGERMIDKALKESNGFLLKDKPMVVMYGKSS